MLGQVIVTLALEALSAVGAPATWSRVDAGSTSLPPLVGVPEADLAWLHAAGPKALRIIRSALQQPGLALR